MHDVLPCRQPKALRWHMSLYLLVLSWCFQIPRCHLERTAWKHNFHVRPTNCPLQMWPWQPSRKHISMKMTCDLRWKSRLGIMQVETKTL